MRRRAFDEWLFDMFGVLMTVLFVVLLAYCIVEAINSIRSEPARVSCRSKQLEPLRYTFTTTVVCVPYPTRQDTLSLRNAK